MTPRSHSLYRIAASTLAALLIACASAFAWDSRTHREITHLAIDAMPPSPLKDFFAANVVQLESYSVQPDVIRERYGDEDEAVRHYINLEYFGADPFAVLTPDIAAMNKRFGAAKIRTAGTLPWTIVEFSNSLEQALARGDCGVALRLAGFLAHYVGDASQPLHTTINYDGTAQDRGVHMRLERAADYEIASLGEAARGETHPIPVESVWPVTIAEIRRANSHIGEVLASDRAARAEAPRGHAAFSNDLIGRERPMIVGQLASGASVLSSIWLYEWKQAGSPAHCAAQIAAPDTPANPQ
ncbi:MAG TPA: hypothetical protein VEU51_14275 [Candidatus Acidoferrales bacterium]|nr:hypothetical protein [Candidatus Acidoferrales bacterium]